jgi:hypothetical protein
VPPKQLISARDSVQDVRSGMTDSGLIENYNLSPNRLQHFFKKLLDSKTVTADELDGRSASLHDAVQYNANSSRLESSSLDSGYCNLRQGIVRNWRN